jgi:uncharacterized alkaline shock family protein YloU
MSPEPPEASAEAVESAAASAHISHSVIAIYAAAAATEVAGVDGLFASHSTPPQRAIDPERVPRGVRVSGDGHHVDLELHLVTVWGAHIPSVAADVDRQVRSYLASMIELEPRSVAIVVDGVAPPVS